MDDVKLIEVIAEIGSKNKSEPYIKDVEIFRHFFDKDFNLITNELNSLDGNCTRRELITRFLLLNAVLDQGPDTEGVRQLLCDTINYLYRHEIRILHTPLDFFKELGIIITEIDNVHDIVKKLRAKKWARNNNSTALKYNLFMDNTTQTLNYAVFRWGVPLSVPLILENDYKEILIKSGEVIKTATISIGNLKKFFEDLTNDGSSVIYISFSSKKTRIYYNALVAKKELPIER